MSSLIALLFGAGVGISSALLHNGYQPVGLLISLFATWLGSLLITRMYQSRAKNLLFAIGWLIVIVRASSLGNGGELLIEANGYGNALVLVGFAILTLSVYRARRVS